MRAMSCIAHRFSLGGQRKCREDLAHIRFRGHRTCTALSALIILSLAFHLLIAHELANRAAVSTKTMRPSPSGRVVMIGRDDNFSRICLANNISAVPWPSVTFELAQDAEQHNDTESQVGEGHEVAFAHETAKFWQGTHLARRDLANPRNSVKDRVRTNLEHERLDATDLQSLLSLDLYGGRQVWPFNAYLYHAIIFDDGVIRGYSTARRDHGTQNGDSGGLLMIPKGCRRAFAVDRTGKREDNPWSARPAHGADSDEWHSRLLREYDAERYANVPHYK